MPILDFLRQDATAFLIAMGVLGLAVGSFLNVVIHRLPQMMENEWRSQCAELLGSDCANAVGTPLSLSTPPSRCPGCGHKLGILENIPILSFFKQRGRCANCHAPIAWRYPLVELLGAMAGVAVAAHFGFGWQALLGAMLSWALIALSFIDFDTQYLPDTITLPFLWLGIGANIFGLFTDLHSSVIGAMLGYGSLWSVYHLFKLLTGKEGMGFGDFKLLGCIGAWLGWQTLPHVILLSSVVGSVVGISIMVLHRTGRDLKIPFGPYLASAGWIAMMWGDAISQWYLRFLGM